MGVLATYCTVCGLPIQHDHYVPTAQKDMWAIYRTTNRPTGHFPFTPEHDWLLKGVAINESEGPFLGSCTDGVLEDENGEGYYVSCDEEDYLALHQYCWQEAGKPRSSAELFHLRDTFARTFLFKYQQQLFDFAKCQAEDQGWMLIDPELPEGARNKERIQKILHSTPKPVIIDGEIRVPRSVAELLASDHWLYKQGKTLEGDFTPWRFRNNVDRAIDKTGYPHGFWLSLNPSESTDLARDLFEIEFYHQAQKDGLAVALLTAKVGDKTFFGLQTQDSQALESIVRGLGVPSAFEIQIEDDPEWVAFFEEFYPGIETLRGYF